MRIREYDGAWQKSRNASFNKYAGAVLDYLKKKYDTEFEIIGLIGQSLGSPYDRWGVKPLNEDIEPFSAFGCLTCGSYEISDSYTTPSGISNCKEKIHRLIEDQNADYKSEIQIHVKHSKSECRLCAKIILLIKNTDRAEKDQLKLIENICGKISAAGFMTMINWFIVAPEVYDSAKMSDLAENLIDFKRYALNSGTAYVNMKNRISVYQDESMMQPVQEGERIPLLTVSQLERLCTIIYLDGIIENQGMENLGAILSYIKEFDIDGEKTGIYEYPCEMNGEEWLKVIEAVLSDKALSCLKIAKSIDVTEKNSWLYGNILPGHRAVCFMDRAGAAFIVFRGTSGDYEWYDNAEGMVYADTTQQLASRQFIVDVKEDKKLNTAHITAAGHSKGGNKAQYAAVTAPAGYVDRCVSIDGQGFSEQFFYNYKREILDRRGIVYLMAERRDFVNCLGLQLYGTTFYSGDRGKPENGRCYGDPLPYFHCPDALRDESGMLGEASSEGAVTRIINDLTTFFLTDARYKSLRYDISIDIIALMMKNKKSTADEIAEALINLTNVCLQLLYERKSYRNSIVDLVYSETDLLLATITASADNETEMKEESSIKQLYFNKLKSKLVKDSGFRKLFVYALLNLAKLLAKMLFDSDPKIKKLMDYIQQFIEDTQEEFIKKTFEKLLNICKS